MKYWLLFGTSMMFACLNSLNVKEDEEDENEEEDEEYEEGDEVGDCLDGEDNDEDGLIDCDDDGCIDKPACENDTGIVDTGDTEDTGDTDTDTDTNDGPPTVSISDIQQGDVDELRVVRLEDVVVTSEVTPDGQGFFVQDSGGGAWSGIYVYMNQIVSPSVGDVITLTGVYNEFYDFSQITLEAASEYEVTGSEQPVVTTVTSPSGDWESYEGCLVKFNDQGVTSAMNSYGEVELAMGLDMDNLFFDFSADYGGHYDSVTGVISYSFEEFKINPRSEADLVGYSYESTSVTIPDIQAGSYTNHTVTLESVIVTAVDGQYGNFWVQEYGGGEWSGLYVYTNNILPNVSIGDVINLSGQISEYYDLTELTISSSADIVPVTTIPSPTPVSVTSTPSDWENYESVLVTLHNVEVGPEDQYEQFEISNYPGMLIDNQLYNYSLVEGNTINSITGVVHYTYGEFKILPRYGSDFVGLQ